MEDRPPALVDRVLAGAALHDGAPVGVLQFHVHTELFQQIGGDVAERADAGKIGGIDDDNFLPGIAGVLQQLLAQRQVALHLRRADLGAERGAAGEQRLAFLVGIGIVAGDGTHIVILVHRRQHRAPNPHIVERRIQVVEAHHAHIACGICQTERHVFVALQQRHQVGLHLFPPIHLARLQSGGGGRGIRNDAPFDTLEVGHLAARGPVRRFLPWHVAVEFLISRTGTGDEFLGQELEWTGPDRFLDLLHRVGLRDAFRHDERLVRRRLAQCIDQQRERRLQRDLQGAIVLHAPLVDKLCQRLSQRVARRPAHQAGSTVLRPYRLAVMEFQSVPQLDQVGAAVIRDGVAFGHLRLRFQFGVHRIQRVVHRIGMVLGHCRRGPDRIERCQIRLRHESQRCRGRRLADGDSGQRRRSRRRAAKLQQSAPFHDVWPPA